MIGNERLSRAFGPIDGGTIMKISDIPTRIEFGVDGQSFIARKTDELELAARRSVNSDSC